MKNTLFQLAVIAACYLIACYDPQPPPQPKPLVCAACGAWVDETDWESHWAVQHGITVEREADYEQ